MSPPCYAFPVSQLSEKVQEDVKGKRRKLPIGMKSVDLSACELLEMPQFKCEVEKPVTSDSQIICQEWMRFFRRCQDKKGSFTVETTAWEGKHSSHSGSLSEARSDVKKPGKPHQWSSSWLDADTPPAP